MEGKYVLLIEDDPALQKAYTLMFEIRNIPLRIVGDGKEMMQLLKKGELEIPAAVIMDLLLPYVSGFEILEEMRQTEKWKDVPTIIVSNVKEEEGLQKAERLGVKKYFIKTGLKLDDAIDIIMGYL
ncbi:hypothetical protein A2Z10_01450 [Candidatus Azambacteria bacterium RBG_16_47_10]|uniref:Response regulatory domain-containing protein n=1 Tax=Candidatus Azambacteria bacterium RBG_16_47_10 TaxID=1797292 RepID=A0A1F5AYL4_9BACT|nr:MAG: hypothetical protein A2Z10_01450 [Candidatus Azambacteria bacterium RBG_16_47_10]